MKRLIIIVLALLLFSPVLGAQEATMNNCLLYDLKGREVRLSDYRGKPVILCFWTTWCPYCRKEIQKLNKISSELDSSGIELLAINVSERESKVARFLKSNPVNFPVLLDKDGDCALSYGVIGIPSYLLIDRQGRVRLETNSFPKDRYEKLLLSEE